MFENKFIKINNNDIFLIYTYNLNVNKNFINFFFNYCFKKNNFLVLDNNYLIIYPLYKFIYGFKNVSLYKNFFFIKPVNFTFKNWTYFFSKFCFYNNVNLLFIFDYNYYSNFYKTIINFDPCVSALVPMNYSDEYIDYPLYTPFINFYSKLVYLSFITQIYFLSYNNCNFYYKQQYLLLFYRFSNLSQNF